jgi:spermidine synthase
VIKQLRAVGVILIQSVGEAGAIQWSEERMKGASRGTLRFQLFLTSFAILFFELACIRWIPAQIRLLGYFINFILLAVFLGIGVGILSGRHKRLWLPPFPLMLFIIVIVVANSRWELNLASTQMLYFGAAQASMESENWYIVPVLFTLVALAFVSLARSLGRLLTALPPLEAYAVDILGSLAGIAAFFVMSLFGLSALIWFALVVGLMLFLLPRRSLLIGLPLMLGALFVVYTVDINSVWSPYYLIRTRPNDKGGYVISVNNTGHQETMHYEDKETFYFRVYDLLGQQPFKRVLVIGAGTGSDVAIALANGAESVDAVEIDPLIYRFGQTLNPDFPYTDPRVHIYIEDGRTFLRNTSEKYDLIVYALPDSLTLTSAYSSIRLESFLLTTESIRDARNRLGNDGALVLYNYYRQNWLIDKLGGMVETVFQSPPYVTTYGEWGRAAVLIAGPRLNALPDAMRSEYREGAVSEISGRGWQMPLIGEGFLTAGKRGPVQTPATDNWPFVYMPGPAIPNLYLIALAMALGIAMVMLLLVAPRGTLRHFDWHFFFLGAAFMLLETRSLVTFALLFGSTWMVNSLVFFAILTSVLIAILFNARFKVRRMGLLYGLLFTLLVINYLVPQRTLLGIENPVLRYTLASILVFLPIFLANVVFSRSFRDTNKADLAFGSNLLGAMVGGICEYAALASGYQSLILLVILFYAIAYLIWRKIGLEGVINRGV